jgi:glycogen operon protein
MLLAGDEVGRSQRGNNNAYCQDNGLSWTDWALDPPREALLAFTRRMVSLRRAHPVFRRRNFFRGRPVTPGGIADIVWLQPDGREMDETAWRDPETRALAVFLSGDGLGEVDAHGRSLVDDSFVLLFNASADPVDFTLATLPVAGPGERLVDTARTDEHVDAIDVGAPCTVAGRALVLVRFPRSRP